VQFTKGNLKKLYSTTHPRRIKLGETDTLLLNKRTVKKNIDFSIFLTFWNVSKRKSYTVQEHFKCARGKIIKLKIEHDFFCIFVTVTYCPSWDVEKVSFYWYTLPSHHVSGYLDFVWHLNDFSSPQVQVVSVSFVHDG